MPKEILSLSEGKKLYFISDLHLGAPNSDASREREEKVVKWLDEIKEDASHIFFVGDIFDFWMEYKYCVPKGFIRFLGKLAQLKDQGIAISFFTGNHDMWMQDYFPKELGIPVYKKPMIFSCADKLFYVGHGDGLGPGDHFYKFLKVLFASSFCLWLFKRLHPNLGMGIANYWSGKSRSGKRENEEVFKGEDEWLWQFCIEENTKAHHDFYVFGHRHLPLDLPVGDDGSRYINLGEWISQYRYASFDGKSLDLKSYDG